MSSDRFFAHFSKNRASLAMEIIPQEGEEKQLLLAVAFCNHRDQFNRNIAKNILSGRLNTAKDGSQVRLVFNTNYSGEHPKRDIMNPIMKKIKDLDADRAHSEVANFLADVFHDFNGDSRVGPELEFTPSDDLVAVI